MNVRSRRIAGRSPLVVAAAAVLFVGILVLRLAVADPDAAILLLCVIPTALLAAEFGLRGGLVAATLSCVVVALWGIIEAASVGPAGYGTRALTFLLVGGLVGWITDRRRTLEDQNTRQFELSLDLLGVAGFDGYFKHVNPAFERTLGYSAEDICSRPFMERVHPEDRARTQAEAAKLAEVGTDTIGFQNRYRAKDGSYRWFEWTTRAVASEQLLYATGRDITDRKLTERYLDAEHEASRVLAECRSGAEASLALLRVIGECMAWPVGAFWTATSDGPTAELRCTATWQRAGADADGFAAASEQLRLARGTGLPGRAWETRQARWVPDVTREPHPLRVEAGLDGLHACFLLPVPGNADVLAVMEFLGDEVRPPEPVGVQVLTTLAGHLGQFLERKRAEVALAASERETRQILRTAHDAFVAIDRDGVITDWNPQAEATFGWSREEALGRDVADTIMPESDRDRHRRGLERFLASGEGPVLGRLLELTALHRDGREFPVELTISPIGSETGCSFNAFLRDISERKRAEEELAVARDQALEASRLKSDFLATMSHEIRTPMNGVIGLTGLLLETELDPKQRGYAEAVRGSGESLLAIINDILDFSKIEAGRMELEVIDFDLRTVVEEVGELLAGMAHVKGLELITLLHPELPSAVRGDPGRLRQILTNLVANAVKFTETGEVVIRADVADGSAGAGRLVRFEVADTGIGIGLPAQAVIFEPFSQADSSTTRSHGGTGLGLAISRQLVERMGGRMAVESEPGRGSRFSFSVPLPEQPRQRGDLPRKRAQLSGLRVLIVDDNATNRQILEHQVASWGMDGGSADGGPAALEMLRAAHASGSGYHVVLLDMQMPGMDGLALALAIRGDPALAPIPLVLLTSVATRGSADAARRAGMSAYLTKPVRQSQLFDALATVTGGGADAAALVTRHTISEDRARLRPRVLVVEDNAVNQTVAVGMLAALGYRADVAANGFEALAAVARFDYGAVLMDCQMPEMDGYSATAGIRARERDATHLPIIAMTAAAMSGERERCLATGMDDYVSKPISLDELESALVRWVRPVEQADDTATPDPDLAP